MRVGQQVRVPVLLTAGALLLTGLGAVVPRPAATSAAAPSPVALAYDTGVVARAGVTRPVVRAVAMLRCTRYRYTPRTRSTVCLAGRRVTVRARFLGSIVELRNARGVWTRVPYVWVPRTRVLTYSRWLELQLARLARRTPIDGSVPNPPAPAPSTSPSPIPSGTVAPPPAAPPPGGPASTIPLPEGVGVSPTPWLEVPGDDAAKANAYTFISADTVPATAAHWDRCTPITWTVDLTRAPQAGTTAADELARWQQIVAYAARVTGDTFVYVPGGGRVTIDPATDQPVESAWTGTGAAIVITYVAPDDPGSYRSDAVGLPVIGRAGPWYSVLPNGVKQIYRASVQLDYEWLPTASEADHYNLLFHELGHALGLGHVSDPTQVMNGYVSTQDTYRLGDRTGLWRLAQDGCVA